MRWTLLLLTSLTACSTTGQSREVLKDTLLEYSYGIRWGRQDWVKPHLPKQGPSFEPGAGLPGVQVITCEIESVNILDDHRADAVVRVEWYLTSQGNLRTSMLKQRWRWLDNRWEIYEQRSAEGAPFPPPGSRRAGLPPQG